MRFGFAQKPERIGTGTTIHSNPRNHQPTTLTLPITFCTSISYQRLKIGLTGGFEPISTGMTILMQFSARTPRRERFDCHAVSDLASTHASYARIRHRLSSQPLTVPMRRFHML